MMTLIVIMHLSGGSVSNQIELCKSGGFDSAWFFGYRIITHLGVPTFAFISGYFGVRLSIRKIIEMESMAVFYGILVIIINLLSYNSVFSIKEVMELLLPISSGHLWYFSCYMLLMLISPFLNIGIQSMDKSHFSKILVVLVVICFAGHLILNVDSCTIVTLLSIYLIGQYLSKFGFLLFEKYAFCIFTVSLIINLMIVCFLAFHGSTWVIVLSNSNNPLLIISSISLFYVFLKMEKETMVIRWISRIAPCMFSVYVFHESLRLSGAIDISSLNGQLKYVLPMACAVVLIISIIEMLRKSVFRVGINTVVEKLAKINTFI